MRMNIGETESRVKYYYKVTPCLSEFEKWRTIRASVGGVGGVLA